MRHGSMPSPMPSAITTSRRGRTIPCRVNRVSVAVALADKLDTLVGFWAIDEKPTGSKDPYALRRAALGVIRIVLSNALRLKLRPRLIADVVLLKQVLASEGELEQAIDVAVATLGTDLSVASSQEIARKIREVHRFDPTDAIGAATDLLAFFADRLKVHLRDTGARHDLIDAVFALPGQDDLLMIVRRVEALGKFLDTDDGKNLLAGYKRAANILRDEEKKDGAGAFAGPPDHKLIEARGEEQERALFHVMQAAEGHARSHVEAEDFEGAMRALAELRPGGRRVFRSRHRQRRRSGAAGEPAEAPQHAQAGDARRGGFLQDRRLISGSR